MNIIEDIFYGNIVPANSKLREKELMKEICDNEEKLSRTLTEAQKEMLEKLNNSEIKLAESCEREHFKKGFIMGARIIIEVMRKNAALDYEQAKYFIENKNTTD